MSKIPDGVLAEISLEREEVGLGDMYVGDEVESGNPILFVVDPDAPVSFVNFTFSIIPEIR